MALVLTEHVRIGNDGFIIGIGSSTVGDKARITLCIGCQLADLMGDGLAETVSILRHKGDDVALFESRGVNLFDKD